MEKSSDLFFKNTFNEFRICEDISILEDKKNNCLNDWGVFVLEFLTTLKDGVFPNDKKLFDLLWPKLSIDEKKSLFNILLIAQRYDLLKNDSLIGEVSESIFNRFVEEERFSKNIENYFTLLDKGVLSADLVSFISAVVNSHKMYSSVNLEKEIFWEEVTSVLLFFREKLNNKVILDDGQEAMVIEFACKSIPEKSNNLSYRKEFIDDCYISIDKTIKYAQLFNGYLVYSKALEKNREESVIRLFLNEDLDDKRMGYEEQVATLQNIELIIPLLYKMNKWNHPSVAVIREYLRECPFYFMYMEMRSTYGLDTVQKMVNFINTNPDFLDRYIKSSGFSGIVSGTDIRKEIIEIHNYLSAIKPYVSLYNYIDDSITDGDNNFFLRALDRLKVDNKDLDLEENWDFFLYNFKNLANSDVSLFLTFKNVVKKKYIKSLEGETSLDLLPVFSLEDKNIFIKENLQSSNDILKDFAKKFNSNSYRSMKDIAKADALLNDIDTLYDNFPNFEKVTEYIEDMLRLQMKGNGMFYIPPLILAGPPGVGKTHYLTTVMNMAKTFMNMVSYQNITANFVLTGGSSSWSNASPGLIFNTIMNNRCNVINPIIVLDEIDKNGSGNYSTEDCLLGVLEKHTARMFKDECVPIPIDTSYITWLATANNLENVSAPMKNRFDIIDIPLPNLEQKRKIVRNIYKSLIDENPWGNAMDKNLPEDTVEKLVNVLNKGVSRDLRKMITKSCAKSLKEDSKNLLPQYVDYKEEERLPWDS